MSTLSAFMYRVSEALSEVMDDIGVNETLVMKRRRTLLLLETMRRISTGYSSTENVYHFGSQSEGSTTLGLDSDIDTLFSFNRLELNVMQQISEWQRGAQNFMIIQNQEISPGYCYLQPIRINQPVPATPDYIGIDILVEYVTDSEGRLVWKNNALYFSAPDLLSKKHGPAFRDSEQPGQAAADKVIGFYFESSPHQVTSWLQKQRHGKWPTEDVLKDCSNAGCFIVPVGSKVHAPGTLESNLEWRISTSLQERYVMFSLNIPQLRCYILMKMILITHINPNFDEVLTSFMCKNVLFYCVAYSSHEWHTGNLLSYLHLCLFMLKECVEQRNCPHFMIPDNNLLTGHMTETQRGKLLEIIKNLIKDDKQVLFEIHINDLGRRLNVKLNMIPNSPNNTPATNVSLRTSVFLVHSIAMAQNECLTKFLFDIKHKSIKMAHQNLSQTISRLSAYRILREDDLLPHTDIDLLHTACDLLIPLVSSVIGSVIANRDIDTHTAISDEAFTYLEAGKESDALSGRLKLVSVLYCTGDMDRAGRELNIIQAQYNLSEVHTLCSCYPKGMLPVHQDKKYESTGITFEQSNEKAIKSNVAFCTKFLQCEINCVPNELRYEILKSYLEEDIQLRTDQDSEWMDLIVVDSIPYLYFLRYKIYGHLHKGEEQRKALFNLSQSIDTEPNLHHTETTLSLLGQCWEQENVPINAFSCYIRSLKHRKRNNAARWLLCILLLKLLKRDNPQ